MRLLDQALNLLFEQAKLETCKTWLIWEEFLSPRNLSYAAAPRLNVGPAQASDPSMIVAYGFRS
jgi:hypothetical protein